MNNEFVQRVLSIGQEGKVWLEEIPQTIKEYEIKWSIKVSEPFNLNYHYVAPAVKDDGSQVVLKIGLPGDTEFETEIEALSIFNGEGIAKLLEADKKNRVILVERVLPGIPLNSLEDDDNATRILASVMKKLHKPLSTDHKFITITTWIEALDKYKNDTVPVYLVDKAKKLFDELIATSATPVLVHGDLHHDNVLSSDREGWLAIDPKGIAAEPAYEAAAMIRNPYNKMKNIPNIKEVLRRRIQILSEELGVDTDRIHRWCFVQTVLSAVWSTGDIKGPEHAIMVAQELDKLNL